MNSFFKRFVFVALALTLLCASTFAGTLGTAVRTMPATYTPGVAFNVLINVTPLAETTVYGVSETVPEQWVVTNVACQVVSTGEYCSPQDFIVNGNVIEWAFTNDTPFGLERNLTYTLTPAPNATGTKVFTSNIESYVGANMVKLNISGASSISKTGESNNTSPPSGSNTNTQGQLPIDGTIIAIAVGIIILIIVLVAIFFVLGNKN